MTPSRVEDEKLRKGSSLKTRGSFRIFLEVKTGTLPLSCLLSSGLPFVAASCSI